MRGSAYHIPFIPGVLTCFGLEPSLEPCTVRSCFAGSVSVNKMESSFPWGLSL